MDNIRVGLDIGTANVTAVIGEYGEDRTLNIVGVGKNPSTGLRRGVIVNIESSLESIGSAISQAEQMAGCEVSEVIAAISGGHIEGINSRGVVAVAGRGREINERDIERVLEAARAVVIPIDREVLHVIPQEFIVDAQKGIKNPLGMIGVRLEAEVHIITGAVSPAQNLVRSINRAGFKVSNLMLESLAASKATLTQDEKELGTLLIDIGAGITKLIIYRDGAPYFTGLVPIGASQITSDISMIFKIAIDVAENLKKQFGCCQSALAGHKMPIVVPGAAGRVPIEIYQEKLTEVIEPRVQEIFRLICNTIAMKGYQHHFGGGVVLTGGCAMLPGITDTAQEIFNTVTRIGQPGVFGTGDALYQSPDCATAVGLLMHEDEQFVENKKSVKSSKGVFGKIKKWASNFF